MSGRIVLWVVAFLVLSYATSNFVGNTLGWGYAFFAEIGLAVACVIGFVATKPQPPSSDGGESGR